MDLLLRPTVTAGDKLKDDYCVIHEGRSVGRIQLASEQSSQRTVWEWHVNLPLPIPRWCNGSADSLEAAKQGCKDAWEKFYASLTPERIRRWHLIEDLALSNEWWLE
ncbi:hypothetical protein [Nitrobacter winogradskyi]|uniref:Uncharacterized protein n=2 Tax=Nitrobacter winogradskyi TaxID=913 RepID=A0ACC6AJ04_NITWI|nr:hypothetical protein [Nitrobacter winogradskyi]MCP1998845.1 hypothetical protein [Nitrobacter winogradskyi]GEC14234.1 hypothetical protein NWI01_01260 [Nitrobacter winogradskyi]